MASRASVESNLKKWLNKERRIRNRVAKYYRQLKKLDRAANAAGNIVDDLRRQLGMHK